MAKLIYTAITSLDGYVADATGDCDWSVPDEEVHAFVNDLERPIGTHLYGRRMYEVLQAWETMDDRGEPPAMRDYATIWRAADKIVFSRDARRRSSSARTRIERDVRPRRRPRAEGRGGRRPQHRRPDLAAEALRAGLVDEIQLLCHRSWSAAATRALPDDVRIDLELLDERRFGNGVVYLRYGTV